MSFYFKGIVWTLAVLDEVHQLEFFQVAAVASAAKFLVLLYDEAQRIKFARQYFRTNEEVDVADGDYYSWERAVHIAGSILPWAYIREDNIQPLNHSWRFGKANCIYQRFITTGYGPNTDSIWSPEERDGMFAASAI